MTAELSVYLDAVRLFAALSVFLGHCAWRWTPGLFAPFRTYGWTEAVLVFFVLSGFVIGHVVQRKERDPRTYAINRAARIYSVALPALVATFVLDFIGRHLRPDLYNASWGYASAHMGKQFVRSLFFLNEVWTSRSQPGSNGPFWSLAYEVCYYLAFGLITFVPGRKRFAAAGVVLLAAGPIVAALFPVWLLGLLCQRIAARRIVGERTGWLLCVGALVLLVALECGATALGLRAHPAPLFAHRWQLLQDYALALCLAAHLLGAATIAPSLSALTSRVATPVKLAASATFTLYLFHFPIAQLLSAIDPWPDTSWPSVVLILAGTLSSVWLISRVTENRKEAWRHAFSLLTSRWSPPPRALRDA
jgi:peptidoglycan/LPS O-acetylase OafA/YrhL